MSPPSLTKTPATAPRRPSISKFQPASSMNSLYHVQDTAATHEQMMQRFHIRRVASDSAITFAKGRNVVIDKLTSKSSHKTRRFSLHRFLRSLMGTKARNRALHTLATPISPKSWACTVHGVVMIAVYYFQLLYIPFGPSFYPHGSQLTSTIALILETLFLGDLLLNFNTAYIEDGTLINSRAKIALNYLRKWLIIDVLSAIPLQAAYNFTSGSSDLINPSLRGIQYLLMVLRLLRVSVIERGTLCGRVIRISKQLSEWMRYSRYSHLLGIAQLMSLVLLIAHYMACFWHVIAQHSTPGTQGENVMSQYIADYYYAVSLIQGQGNISSTWGENLYSSVAIIVGSVILAIVFGNVAMLVSNFNANTTSYHRKMEAVYATMDKLDLPLKLRERVNEYYTHVWLEYEALDGNINKFQQELTHTLRIEIGLYKFMNLVVQIPFWEDCSSDFLTQIVLSLGVRVYMPDDYVVRRREIGSEMMMINLGYCKVSKASNAMEAEGGEYTNKSCGSGDNAAKSGLVFSDLGWSSHLDACDCTDADSDDSTSDDDSADDFVGRVVNSYRSGVRRTSGSMFELHWVDQQDAQAKVKVDHSSLLQHKNTRRHSDSSNVGGNDREKLIPCVLNPGQTIGEMSLLMNYKRQTSVRAVTYVEVSVLDRVSFQNIISRYLEDRRRVLTKMLESCIEKKEVPFPWESIIEAVSAKRRSRGSKETSRDRVVATMTASEAASVLVQAIDVNVPDQSIKYGFQNLDQDYIDDAALSRAHSVAAKIRDTLHRSNSSPNSLHQGSRTPKGVGSNSSSSTGDLTDNDSDTSRDFSPDMETALEKMMQMMYVVTHNIGRLEENLSGLTRHVSELKQDVNEMKQNLCDLKQREQKGFCASSISATSSSNAAAPIALSIDPQPSNSPRSTNSRESPISTTTSSSRCCEKGALKISPSQMTLNVHDTNGHVEDWHIKRNPPTPRGRSSSSKVSPRLDIPVLPRPASAATPRPRKDFNADFNHHYWEYGTEVQGPEEWMQLCRKVNNSGHEITPSSAGRLLTKQGHVTAMPWEAPGDLINGMALEVLPRGLQRKEYTSDSFIAGACEDAGMNLLGRNDSGGEREALFQHSDRGGVIVTSDSNECRLHSRRARHFLSSSFSSEALPTTCPVQ